MTVAARGSIRFVPEAVMGIGRHIIKVRIIPLLVICSILFVLMTVLFMLSWFFKFYDGLIPLVTFSCPVLIALCVIAHDRRIRFRERRDALRSGDELLLALMHLRSRIHRPIGMASMRANWDSALQEVKESVDPPVIAVCSENLQSKITDIDELKKFPEPESLGVGGITRWGVTSLFVLLGGGLSTTCFLISGSGRLFGPLLEAQGTKLWVLTVIGLVILGFTIFGTPIRGFVLRRWRRGSGSFMIGPGFLTEGNARAFTVADSILMVDSNPREVNTEIRVLLLGPKHLRRFRFNSVRDRSFIKLWQCWTHPEPRPELAG